VNIPATPIATTQAAGFLPECLSALAAGPDWAPDPDTATIERLAPHIFVLECQAGGPPIYRCAGRAIQAALGFDPCGEGFYQDWNVEAPAILQPYFDRSAQCHWAFRLSSFGPGPDARQHHFETVLIPVLSDDPGKSCFIGISLMQRDSRPETGPQGTGQQLEQVSYLGEGGPMS
jgi:hypothetical protein